MIPDAPWELPESAVIGGEEWEINSDFRCALDTIAAMNDREIDDGERTGAVLSLLFPDYEDMHMSHVQEVDVPGGLQRDRRLPVRAGGVDQEEAQAGKEAGQIGPGLLPRQQGAD